MQENGRNIFRTVVAKVSSFVGNPVFFHDKRLSDLYVVKPEKLTVYFLNENFCAPERVSYKNEGFLSIQFLSGSWMD